MLYSIRQARAMVGLTQAQMAAKMGVSRDTYRKIEKNPETATITQAYQIERITGIGLDQIFFGVNSTLSRAASET